MGYTVAVKWLVPWIALSILAVVGPGTAIGQDTDGDGLLDDITENENFETTEGLDLIWRLQADPTNVALSSVGAELEGMSYYDTEYRWPAVRGSRGGMTVTVPKAGSYYPAVVVYDTAGPEAYELEVEGERVGRFLAAEDDNRQRVHFLTRPIDFAGGEKLTFRVGTVGNHITEDILLLAEKPPIRLRKFEMSHQEAARVEREGKPHLRLTWITTWPSACTVEYGASEQYGGKLTEEGPVANHRVFLSGFEPGAEIHYRIVAPRPDGQQVIGGDTVFRFEPPAPVVGTAQSEKTELKVENPHPFALQAFPITSGVPFARGELGDADHVRLLDAAGREVALQAKVASRWADGSVQWLRLSFLASVEAETPAIYFLEYGTEITRARATSPLRHAEHDGLLAVDTGPLHVEFDARQSGFPTSIRFDADADGKFADDEELATEQPLATELIDAEGRRYTTACAADRIEIEQSGPVRTVVKLTGDHGGAYLNNYDWSNCRTNGWHLLLTMAVYRMTNDPYYLNAARIIIERTLERQTPGGGWHRQMVPGHCHDMPRHRGVANFMLGVLANGLEEYYREVSDPRVAEAILGGAGQAVRELWVEEARGFRYTSCPNMTGYTSNNDMTSEILFFAQRLGGDEEFGRIALVAMEAAFDGGIGSTAHLRWTPHIIYNIDLLRQKRATRPE